MKKSINKILNGGGVSYNLYTTLNKNKNENILKGG